MGDTIAEKNDVRTDVQVQNLVTDSPDAIIVETTTTTTTTTTTKRVRINTNDKNIDLTEIRMLLNDDADTLPKITNATHASGSHLKSSKKEGNKSDNSKSTKKNRKRSFLSSTQIDSENEEHENMDQPKPNKSLKNDASSELLDVSEIRADQNDLLLGRNINNRRRATHNAISGDTFSQTKKPPKTNSQLMKNRIPVPGSAQHAKYLDDLISENMIPVTTTSNKVKPKPARQSMPKQLDLSAILENSAEVNEALEDDFSDQYAENVPFDDFDDDELALSPRNNLQQILTTDENDKADVTTKRTTVKITKPKQTTKKASKAADVEKPKAPAKAKKTVKEKANKEAKEKKPATRGTRSKAQKPPEEIAMNFNAFDEDTENVVPPSTDTDVSHRTPAEMKTRKLPKDVKVSPIVIYSPTMTGQFKKTADNKVILTKKIIQKSHPQFCQKMLKRFNAKGEFLINAGSTLKYYPSNNDDESSLSEEEKVDYLAVLSKRRQSRLIEEKPI